MQASLFVKRCTIYYIISKNIRPCSLVDLLSLVVDLLFSCRRSLISYFLSSISSTSTVLSNCQLSIVHFNHTAAALPRLLRHLLRPLLRNLFRHLLFIAGGKGTAKVGVIVAERLVGGRGHSILWLLVVVVGRGCFGSGCWSWLLVVVLVMVLVIVMVLVQGAERNRGI